MVEGQRILLGASTEEMAKLSVTDIVVPFEVLYCTAMCCTALHCTVLCYTALHCTDIVVPFEDLGDAKPSVEQSEECDAMVTTYSQPQVSRSW